MASSKLPGSHKRTRKPHDVNTNDHSCHPTPRDSPASKQHDLAFRQRCQGHIMSLRLSAEEKTLDVESFDGVDWLREEAPWPLDVQQRVHRYMHEKNLYHVRNSDDPAFVDLVDLVKSQAGVRNTRKWDQKVLDKCRSLIDASANAWKRDGLLVVCNNLTKKTEAFQYYWNCAKQVAHLNDQSFPRDEPGDTDVMNNFDSMARPRGRREDGHSEKRSAENLQQSQSSSSAKRQCVRHRNLQNNDAGDSMVAECDVSCAISPEGDLAGKDTAKVAAVSVAAPASDRHQVDGTMPARLRNGLESSAITARKAPSALSPAEEGKKYPQKGIQLSEKKISPDFAQGAPGDPPPAGPSIHKDYRMGAKSWSPSDSSPIYPVQRAATVDGLDQAASLKAMVGPDANENDSSLRAHLPSLRQTTNKDIMNISVSPGSSSGHATSSSQHHNAESMPHKPKPIIQIIDLEQDNAPETSPAETRHSSSTAQIPAQASQTFNPPNHQPPPLTFTAQSSPSTQPGGGGTHPGNSDTMSEYWYSPSSSENSESSDCSGGATNAPRVAANPQNSGDSLPPFGPPPKIIDQGQDTQLTRLGPLVPPPPPRPSPISSQNSSAPPPPPSTFSPNARPDEPPPPPPQHAPNLYQGAPPPPVSRQNVNLSDHPPPPAPRTSNQNLGPPLQIAQPNAPPPLPQHSSYDTQCPYPTISLQNKRSVAPVPPHPPFSPNAWPNGPLPASPRPVYQNQRPPPLTSVSQYHNQRPPPLISSVSQYHNHKPPGTTSPCPAQGQPSDLAASTEHSSPYLTNATNPVAGLPPHRFQSFGQEQPSLTPGHSAQFIGQPPPAPLQNQGSPFAEPGPALELTSPNLMLPTGGPTSALMWKKYNNMAIFHVANGVHANVNNNGLGEVYTGFTFLAEEVLKKNMVEPFQWISSLLNSALPSQLVFDFSDVQLNWRRRIVLHQGDSKSFETMKTIAWGRFMDPAVAQFKILIRPLFSGSLESYYEGMQRQSQSLHSANTASAAPFERPAYVPLPNQGSSSVASDSVRRPSTTKLVDPPPSDPLLKSLSDFLDDTIEPHGGLPNPPPNSMPIPPKKTTPKINLHSSNSNNGEAPAPLNLDPQRQSHQQQTQVVAPNSTELDNSHTSAKIVVRIQIDGHGRLSRSYDKSTLSTRITCARFFAWFAEETGYSCSTRLRFNFKDAMPVECSTIETGNENHFTLMVRDIKRKLERAQKFAPDLNEFCIVVTDPLWDSGDESDDD